MTTTLLVFYSSPMIFSSFRIANDLFNKWNTISFSGESSLKIQVKIVFQPDNIWELAENKKKYTVKTEFFSKIWVEEKVNPLSLRDTNRKKIHYGRNFLLWGPGKNQL